MPTGTAAPTPLDRALAAELRGLVARRAMRQVDIAEACHMPPSSLSKMLAGRKPMNVAHLVAIASALGVEPRDVMGSAQAALERHPDWFADDPEAARGSGSGAVPSRPAHARTPSRGRGERRTR